MTGWLAVDWGATYLRVWPDGDQARLRQSDRGMNTLAPDAFGPALADLTQDVPATLAVACGMVGARQGWAEVPYRTVPCTPHSPRDARIVTHGALRVHILPGLSQAAPADVMRGEETQIAGFLALNPGWDGVICLPGTHTKWAHVSAGEVVSFQTFVTGELFDLIGTHSVLRHSLAPGHDDDAFADAVHSALARPASLASGLFRLRAENLLDDLPPYVASARLSGLLIGAELSAAKPYWLGQQVGVIGAGQMADNYAAALSAQGLPVQRADAGAVTLAGLTAAYEALT